MFENDGHVIFCFGEGGHAAQATRLFAALKPHLGNVKVWTVGDFCEMPSWSDRHFYFPPLRDKEYGFTLSGCVKVLTNIKRLLIVVGNSATNGVVSTGPGFCAVVCLIARFFRKPVVHIETWSRLETRSLTGRLCYWVCNRFYVQHQEQLRFYKSAKYCGLL